MSENYLTVIITALLSERRSNIKEIISLLGIPKASVIIADQNEFKWHTPPSGCYFWYPASKYNLYEMLFDVIAHKTNTSYIFWLSDDDFATPSGIEHCISHLKTHPSNKTSYISGEVVKLDKKNKLSTYGLHSWKQKPVASDDVFQRLKEGFHNVLLNPHAMISRPVWLHSLRVVLNSLTMPGASLAPIRFFDKIIMFYCLLFGKRMTDLDCLSLVRTSVFGRLVTDYEAHLPDCIELNTGFSQIHSRRLIDDPFARDLSRVSGRDVHYCKVFVDEIFKTGVFKHSAPTFRLGYFPHKGKAGNKFLQEVRYVLPPEHRSLTER